MDGHFQGLPSYGYYVVDTGYFRCFVDGNIRVRTQTAEFQAVVEFLKDPQFKATSNIKILTDSRSTVETCTLKANGKKRTRQHVGEILSLVGQRNVTWRWIPSKQNLCDKLLRKAVQQHYQQKRWEYAEVIPHPQTISGSS